MIRKILVSAFLTGMVITSQSAPIDQSIAVKAAGNFIKQRSQLYESAPFTDKIVSQVMPLSDDEIMAYAVNFAGGGFVIISAENAAKPILAYSYEGSFSALEIPDQISAWLQVYYNKIHDIRQNNIPATDEIQMEWERLLDEGDPNPLNSGSRDVREVAPLLTTTWDQGALYNKLCPVDPMGPGGHVWSGCVATAMSQIINYWRYPMQGNGSHGYYSDYGYLFVNFENSFYNYYEMNNSIAGESNYEMAEIQYHCGVAVNMMYSASGSGAYSDDAADALKNYFGYSQNLELEYKDDYSEAAWAELLILNLDNGWPMYYHGFGSGGHAFNVDGYQGDDYFHFNWGWSGSYNGYYYLSNLNPGGNDFTWGQGAIVNFYPDNAQYPYYCSGVTTLTRHSGTIEDGSGPVENYIDGLSCGWLIAPADSVTGLTLYFDKFDIASGDVVNVFDGENSSSPLIGSYTGDNPPAAIASTTGKLYLEFLTDGNQGKGFRARYVSSLVNYCPGVTHLYDASGTFSDGSGTRNYRNNSFCKYIIEPDSAATITISFDEFATETENDKVRIYDMVSQQMLAEYSGDEIPEDITIPSGKAYIIFMTNDSINNSGWQISYTSTVTAIDEFNVEKQVKLYCSPNPANDWLRLDLRTRTPENITITISGADGRTAQLYKGITNAGSMVVTADISSYAPGLYFVKYVTESESGLVKIVIQ